MPPPLPPEEIIKLMRFVAAKTKNVTSPMNVTELCRQFKEETGSSVTVNNLTARIDIYRLKIHGMPEFDTETKVKMLFALRAPIDAGFLEELKKVAEVKVDDQQRIIRYEQKDGALELSAKYRNFSVDQGEKRNRGIIQFLAEKSRTVDTPVDTKSFVREFKKKTGCPDSMHSLRSRYWRVKSAIYQTPGIDKKTKIKMMFISNVKLSDDVLKKLRKDADVEVDKVGRITKYKANNGKLNLEGNHELSSIKKSYFSERWHKFCEKIDEVVSENDDEEDANWLNDSERKGIELVRFIIERTKNVTSPLSLYKLAKDYKTDSKCPEGYETTVFRIKSFRQRIPEINRFDTPTKVKLIFALSSSIDANFLKELRKDAIVELDGNLRIKKYEAKDGSLELEGDHEVWAKGRSGNTRSNQTPFSSSARRNDRLRNTRISLRNENKKRQRSETNSDSTHTRNHARMSRGNKRARISYSSSEASEKDDHEESAPSDDDSSMENEDNNVENGGDDYDYDPPSYHQHNEGSTTRVQRGISGVEDPNDVDDEPPQNHPEDEEVIAGNTLPVEQEPLVGGENPQENHSNDEQDDVKVSPSAPVEQKPHPLLAVSGTVKEEPSRTSIKELLILLRGPLMAIRSPSLDGICAKFDTKIQELATGNRQMPLENLHVPLDSCLLLLLKNAALQCEEEATSLRDFLLRFQATTCHIIHPTMASFHQKLKTKISELSARDERIPITIVDRAMDNTLLLLAP